MNNQNRLLPPSRNCITCGKSLEETGGKRILTSTFRKIIISTASLSIGSNENPMISVKLENGLYLNLLAPEENQSRELLRKAVKELEQKRHPWFCQRCCNRICPVCGAPVQYLHGCDILHDDGSSGHYAILPVQPGCTNPGCGKHRKGGGVWRRMNGTRYTLLIFARNMVN